MIVKSFVVDYVHVEWDYCAYYYNIVLQLNTDSEMILVLAIIIIEACHKWPLISIDLDIIACRG